MRRAVRLAAFIIVAGLIALVSAESRAASLLEKNFWLDGPRYDANLPRCDTPAALSMIASKFETREKRFWNSDLRIVEFLRVQETAMRPWAVDTIPRRFCSGTVMVSDGRRRRVNYSIIEDGGSIGATWGVEWCVVGLDRNWAYSPACRVAGP